MYSVLISLVCLLSLPEHKKIEVPSNTREVKNVIVNKGDYVSILKTDYSSAQTIEKRQTVHPVKVFASMTTYKVLTDMTITSMKTREGISRYTYIVVRIKQED